jgi:hypothetical protein
MQRVLTFPTLDDLKMILQRGPSGVSATDLPREFILILLNNAFDLINDPRYREGTLILFVDIIQRLSPRSLNNLQLPESSIKLLQVYHTVLARVRPSIAPRVEFLVNKYLMGPPVVPPPVVPPPRAYAIKSAPRNKPPGSEQVPDVGLVRAALINRVPTEFIQFGQTPFVQSLNSFPGLLRPSEYSRIVNYYFESGPTSQSLDDYVSSLSRDAQRSYWILLNRTLSPTPTPVPEETGRYVAPQLLSLTPSRPNSLPTTLPPREFMQRYGSSAVSSAPNQEPFSLRPQIPSLFNQNVNIPTKKRISFMTGEEFTPM